MRKLALAIVVASLIGAAFASEHLSFQLATAQDLTATTVFSIAGALVMLNALGKVSFHTAALIFAGGFMTANGGGTARDVALGQWPFWLSEVSYVLIPALATSFVLAMRVIRDSAGAEVIAIADDLSTGVFIAIGVTKISAVIPLDSPLFVIAAILSGVSTGIGGGMLRDCLLLRRTPAVLETPLFINVTLCGGLLAVLTKYEVLSYWGLETAGAISCLSACLIFFANRVRSGKSVPRISDPLT